MITRFERNVDFDTIRMLAAFLRNVASKLGLYFFCTMVTIFFSEKKFNNKIYYL